MDPQNFTVAFSVWAAVVALVGAATVWQLSQLRKEVKDLRADLNVHILNIERRITHIETYMGLKSQDFAPLNI